MKILTRKQQDEILKLLSANHIIADNYMDIVGYGQTLMNISDIAFLIDGISGVRKVGNTVERWIKDGEQNEHD